MRPKWSSRDSNQELIFRNEAGEDAAKALPPSMGGQSGRLSAKDISMSRPKELRLRPSSFWNAWPHLLDDNEIDGPPLTIEFLSGTELRGQFAFDIDAISVNGEIRAASIKFSSHSKTELRWVVQSFPKLRLLFLVDGDAGNGLSCLRELSQLWGLLLAPVRPLEPDEASTDWSELNALVQLKVLSIKNFVAPKDLSCCNELIELERLEVRDARSVRSLRGIQRCESLSSLTITHANRLTKVSELETLRSLESLELSEVNALEVIPELGALSGLKQLTIRSHTLRDIGPLEGHPSLEKVSLQGPGFNAEWAANRRVLKTLPQLEKLSGFQPKVLDEVLFCTAALRGDTRKMRRLLDDVVSGHCDGLPEGAAVRSVVIDQLMSLDLSDSEWKTIHSAKWTVAEWADLFVKTNNHGNLLESQLKGAPNHVGSPLIRFVMPKDEGSHVLVGGENKIKDALKGYIHAVARGNRWDGTEQIIQFAASEFLKFSMPHSSWLECQVDLLLATLDLGLKEQHDKLLAHITESAVAEFKEQLVWRRANDAVSLKRLDEAVECLPLMDVDKQSRLMGRILPLWIEKIPEPMMDWFMEELADLETIAKAQGIAIEEVLQNPFARELAFFLAATDLEDFQKLLINMQKAFPEDAQVKALMAEVGIGLEASSEVLETYGLEMLWQDEALRAEVGERNLRKLMESHGDVIARVREQARRAALDLLRREDLID